MHNATIYRESYVSPVIEKHRVSELKPVHFINGCYSGRQGPFQAEIDLKEISKKCRLDPVWDKLTPLNRCIQVEKGRDMVNNRKELLECFTEKPNKFLKNLSVEYPDVYYHMRKYSLPTIRYKNEANISRSTVQIDYSRLPEYPCELYPEPEKIEQKPEFVLTNFCENLPASKDIIPLRPDISRISGAQIECKNVHRNIPNTSHWPEYLSLYKSCTSR